LSAAVIACALPWARHACKKTIDLAETGVGHSHTKVRYAAPLLPSVRRPWLHSKLPHFLCLFPVPSKLSTLLFVSPFLHRHGAMVSASRPTEEGRSHYRARRRSLIW